MNSAHPDAAQAATAHGRSNQDWLTALGATPGGGLQAEAGNGLSGSTSSLTGAHRGANQATAVGELRGILGRRLRAALAKRSTVTDADLEDWTQDATVHVLQRLGSFRGDSRFLTWATSVAVRCALTALRKRKWENVSLDDLDLEPPVDSSNREPAAVAERDDLLLVLRRLIDTDLTERQRTLILAELAGMPSAVLVERLNTNPNALYKLYHDARKKLRSSLEAAGFHADDVLAMTSGGA